VIKFYKVVRRRCAAWTAPPLQILQRASSCTGMRSGRAIPAAPRWRARPKDEISSVVIRSPGTGNCYIRASKYGLTGGRDVEKT
jgi:hypothetical protein